MRYGRTLALDRLFLDVNPGDLYGLIGPNGAGKTTTFRILATIQRPTAGDVQIGGESLADPTRLRDIRRRIGYMPDSFGVYEDMTVEEYLAFFAAAYDIRNPRRKQLVDDVLKLVDLADRRASLIETLSRGMQQRLGIARVLIHDPDLLILDEPASGLDPRARIEIRGLLQELQRMGKTILISSHILADLGEICNRIGIIEKGRLLVSGELSEVLRMVARNRCVLLRVHEQAADAQALLEAQPFVARVEQRGETLAVGLQDGSGEAWQIPDVLIRHGYKVTYIETEEPSLENAFIALTDAQERG